MTANDLWTSFSIRLSRRVSRRMVGLGMSDSLAFAALVLAAGGALSCAVALVRDLVLRAGAVGGTYAGADRMRRLRLITGFDLVGNWAVVGTTLGAAVGTGGTFGAIDRVMRMSGGGLLSTLGTGCTLGLGCLSGVSSVSVCVALNLFEMRCMSLMSWDASMCLMPLMACAQSDNAFMILSWGVMVGLVMFLC